MKIYKKIAFAFITTALIAIALISITSYLIARTSLASEVIKHLESVASYRNEVLETLLDHNLEKLVLVSSRTQLRLSLKEYIREPQPRHQDKMNRILRDAKTSIQNFQDISVLTLDGRVVASTDLSKIGTVHIDEQFFVRGQGGNIGDIFYLDKNNSLMMHLAGPLILQSEILGVIEVTIQGQAITSMVCDYSELGETGYSSIVKQVTNGGTCIRSPDRIKNTVPSYKLLEYKDIDPVLKRALLKEASAGSNLIDSRGESVLAATRYSGKYDIGLAVRINSAEAFSPIRQLRDIMILIILFSILSTVIVSILISRSITEPIVRLTDVTTRISEGNLELKADVVSKDEIGTLAQSFNKMIETLERDITKRKQAEGQIRQSLREKEKLLAEIHHRVKNNLQIISSLLSLQSGYITDEKALSLVRNCEERVRSMALVHERLYLSEDLSRIDFGHYIHGIALRLYQVYGVDSRAVTFSSGVKDALFTIETAIPLGLILNELLSNALRHAFPGGGNGTITVGLDVDDKTGEYTLTVEDDGVGFPADVDYRQSETLGLLLVNLLADQLDGTVELDRNGGTSFRITFREQTYKRRI